MKRKFLFYLMSLIMLITSCDNVLDVEKLDFDVQVEKTTYKVGENILFKLQGEPRYINFFSGEVGNDYDYLNNSRYVKNNFFSFYFTLQYQYPTTEQQVEVFLLKDFDGDRSDYNVISNLGSDKKIDVTNRYPLVTARNGESGISNKPNLMDLVKPGDKFNIAIRYRKRAPNTAGATIWFSNLKLYYSNGVNSSETALSLKNDFLQYCACNENKIPTRSENRSYNTAPTQYIIMWPNTTATVNTANTAAGYTKYSVASEQDEYWVTKQYTVEDGFEIKDWSKPIKSYTDPKLTFYNYVYQNPGTYKVVFEAKNASAKGMKSLTKEVILTITE
ncbi:hypothetical protein Pedsa_0683 [Pseudopedobacter saltans DSM 12145]|uniref:DUF5017 domain-containing protein n=2 Tax=Pseudopedobacter saltans TaxID=151895 RepID=F0S838_PSESL|nr:hypothetical protein Pedsa_0683 [Pseudopedobacter saltans DSM 12145]